MPRQVMIPRGPQGALERARPYLFTLLLPVVVLAVGSLVLEYGFRVTAEGKQVLHWIELVALAGLLLDPVARLVLASNRRAMLKFRWFEYVLAGGFLGLLAVVYLGGVSEPDQWALRAAHVAIVLSVAVRLVELHQYLAMLKVRPALLMVGSYLTLIGIGTGLLLLPASTADGEPATAFTDALFTATSAVCVTGLTVVDTGTHWTRFGHYVILTLIQLGGLGLMTYASVLALLLWRGMRVRETLVIREVFTQDLRSQIRRLTVFILAMTVIIEAAGAVLLFGLWDRTATSGVMSSGERVFYSVFHSISAFCNAGLGLYADSLMAYRATWQANIVFPMLIVSGGIGFAVLYNMARVVRHNVIGRREAPLAIRRWTLQSKLAIAMTVVLLLAGTVLTLVFESFPRGSGTWVRTALTPAEAASPAPPAPGDTGTPLGETWTERVRGAWFLSVTSRTAGFNTVDTGRLSAPTKFLTVWLMFIGASPGSTGGGIKTVTFAVVLCGVWASLRGRPRAQAFRRSLPGETVRRALAILAVCVAWVAGMTMVIAAWGVQDGARFTFLDILFETTSGFGTVGLSTGTTVLLNTLGRLLISLTMLLGRVGPLTLFVAMQIRTQRQAFDYATEDVAIS